ncbi:sulfatase-like hydrolase/transferase [Chloroflexi bacterium TSY]|nr:sulfatase-like hydrolase/transferase [Chloroflexi bacterium TSY]
MENTLLIVTSDHGEEFLEHGNFFHSGKLYDELIRVPLIIRSPKNLKTAIGLRYSEQVRLLDIVPTIYDVTNTEPPEDELFGHSLLDALQGNSLRPKPAISEYPTIPLWSIRDKGWKYIYNSATDKAELYALEDDPEEKRNLITSAQDKAKHFAEMLQQHWSNIGGLDKLEEEVQEPVVDEIVSSRLKELGYLN